MVKAVVIWLIFVCLLVAGNSAIAAVYGPGTSTSGSYTISWDPISEIPGRRELINYEIVEVFGNNTTKYYTNSTNKAFSKSSNGSYQYTVIAWISNINPVTYDDTVSSSTLGSKTVSVQKPPTSVASFSPTTISEGGSSTYSWSSTNATGCSATGMSGVSGSSGSKTYTASSNMSSNQTVTVNLTCSGTGGSVSKSASLNINYINDAPMISAIANKTINENTNTGNIAFTIGDEESGASSLSMNGTSSNTALVPNGNIAFGGSGANRTVKITPVAGNFGTATITIQVSDGVKSSSESFLLTVIEVNAAPVIVEGSSIALSTGKSFPIDFELYATDADGDSLTWSQNSAPSHGALSGFGVGSARTITYTPSSGYSGTDSFQIKVSDGSLIDTIAVSVEISTLSAPSASTTGDFTISWSSYPEIPGRVEVSSYEITEVYNGVAKKYNTSLATSKSFNKTLNGDYEYSVRVYKEIINPETHDGVLTSSSMGSATVYVNRPPTASASFNPTVISEGGNSTFSWSSTNATSCSATGISGVTGSSGSKIYAASSNMSSNQTVTVNLTCSGTGGSVSTSTSLNINYINDVPTSSTIANKTIDEDGNTGNIGFTVADEETAAGSLIVTGMSSNVSLVPNGAIVFAGSGANRTVKVIPASNKSGSSTITVKVSDGAQSAETTFNLTVNPVNDVPTITQISDVVLAPGQGSGDISFTVGDVETPAGSLDVSVASDNQFLVPGGNIQLGGAGSSRTISILPAAGQYGSTKIDVTVSDGVASKTESFFVTVNPTVERLAVRPLVSFDGEFDLVWASAKSESQSYKVDLGAVNPSTNSVSWNISGAYVGGNPGTNIDLSGEGDGIYRARVLVCSNASGSESCSDPIESSNFQVAISEAPDQAGESPAEIVIPPSGSAEVVASDLTGEIAGAFRVDESGSATYSIPIMTGPSSGGVAPQVSLNYSSQVGNGLVGVGWNIAGLSTITRCRQTFEQDGADAAINLSSTDRFCLDGQRLVVVSGTYGASGAYYRTEIDSLVRVQSKGGAAGSPDYFVVQRKDGSISYYGDTDDSYLDGEIAGRIGKTVWAQSSFSDSVGNTIHFDYLTNRSLGELVIDRIEYASNGSTPATNYLDFDYDESRADSSESYLLGKKQTLSKRLREIHSYSENSELRTYVLHYRLSAASGRSLLESMEECVAGNCLPATTFDWSEPGQGFDEGYTISDPVHAFNMEWQFVGGKPGDVDGDGDTDLVWIQADSSGDMVFRVSFGGAFGLYKEFGVEHEAHSSDLNTWYLVDVNNDGKDDLVHGITSTANGQIDNWKVALSKGDRFETEAEEDDLCTTGSCSATHYDLFDMNGDGLPDLVGLGGRSVTVRHMQRDGSGGNIFAQEVTYPVYLSYDPRGGESSAGPQVRDGRNKNVADFNGDGKADFITHIYWPCAAPGPWPVEVCLNGGTPPNQDRWYILLSQPDNSYKELTSWQITGDEIDESEVKVADFNGDGLSDYVYKISDAWNLTVKINTGNGFANPTINRSISSDKPIYFADENADGYTDILTFDASSSPEKLVVYRWNGNGFDEKVTLFDASSGSNHQHYLLDLTGDGREEFVSIHSDSSDEEQSVTYRYRDFGGEPVDLIRKFNHGFGSATDIDYRRLNDRSMTGVWNYVKYTDAAIKNWGRGSPVFDISGPTYVVSHVGSSAPVAADQGKKVEVDYHYEGARMQAGGRGFLGFARIRTKDIQTGVLTTTTYRQDFPYIGMPERSEKQLPDLTLITEAANTLGTVEPEAGKTFLPFIDISEETTYTLGGEKFSSVTTDTDYQPGENTRFGNVYSVSVTTRDSLDRVVSTQTTVNTYSNNESLWHLGRLTRSEVTTSKPLTGLPDETRISAFTYYPETGLLHTETIEPDDSDFAVTTTYKYDRFGNKTAATLSAAGEADRDTHWYYDHAGRYVIAEENALGQIVSHGSGFNHFGLAETVTDINGVRSGTAYSAFGKPYFQWTETGSYFKTLAADCSAGCSGAPAGTAYKITTSTFDSSQSVEYFDMLGRKLRTASTGFEGRWIYTDTEYDEWSRIDRESLPYFAGGTPAWSDFDYDILGRATFTDVPGNQCDVAVTYDQLQSGSTVRTTQTTSGNPTCDDTKHEDRNALGELIKVRDTAGNTIDYTYDVQGNLATTTTKDVEQGIDITIEVKHDKLGRKEYMVDPDKGRWDYDYTGFGELKRQTDATGNYSEMSYDSVGRMIYREDRKAGGSLEKASRWYYDRDPDCTKVTYAAGKLVFVAESASPIANNCSVDFGQYTYAKLLGYDIYARTAETVTILGQGGMDGDHWEKVEYDRYGRVKLSYDASNEMAAIDGSYTKGTWNHYHPSWGYITQVTSTDYVAGTSGQRYYELTDMDARGNAVETLLGNGLTVKKTYDPISNRLLNINSDLMPGLGIVQDLTFQWHANGNLDYREDESGSKDLYEDFTYDALNRLTSVALTNPGGTVSTAVTYSTSGNITSKTGVGSYRYGAQCGTGYGPHAVCETGNGGPVTSYSYDANGNLVGDSSGRTLSYSVFNKPLSIQKDGHTTEFAYGPDRSRWKRIDDDGTSVRETLYVGGTEKIYKDGKTEIRRYVEGFVITTESYDTDLRQWQADKIAGLLPAETAADHLTSTVDRYLLKDHLGSTDVITDSAGGIVEQLSFDPWGQRRNALDWEAALSDTERDSILDITARGFTGHESLDTVGLIHMNGRIYDPLLGRFVQADSKIDGATSSQGYNRYSYVHNNPLAFTDPTGYSRKSDGYTRAFLQTVFQIAACTNAVTCAIGSAAIAKMNGGSNNDMLRAAATAYVSAKAFEQIGAYGAENSVSPDTAGAVQVGKGVYVSPETYKTMVFAHAMVGGLGSALSGGKFGHGFVSAFITKAVSPGIGKLPESSQLVVSMIVGGTVSEATGGKFANGAVTAAFSWVVQGGGEIFFDSSAGKDGPIDMADLKTRQQAASDRVDKFYENGVLSDSQRFSGRNAESQAAEHLRKYLQPITADLGIELGGWFYSDKSGIGYSRPIIGSEYYDGFRVFPGVRIPLSYSGPGRVLSTWHTHISGNMHTIPDDWNNNVARKLNGWVLAQDTSYLHMQATNKICNTVGMVLKSNPMGGAVLPCSSYF